MAQQDIEIVQGSTFEWLALIRDVNGLPLDMTNYIGGTAGVRGALRKCYTSTTSTAFSISIADHNAVDAAVTAKTLHLTTAQIAALEPQASGKCYLIIRLTATTTAGIARGNYVYDIEIEDTTGYVFKPFWGTAVVTPEATKA